MKKQIKKLSPHQNGKVIGILMAVSFLPIFIVMAIIMSQFGPQIDQHGNPVQFPYFMFIIMPIFYLIFGYIFVAIGCVIYNYFFKFIGGLEFEVLDKNE
jgi:hypothetical protein